MSKKKLVYTCSCGRTFPITSHITYCPYCAARLRIAKVEIEVSGTNANEVQQVAKSLIEKIPKQEKPLLRPNPWLSGSFYLAVIVVIGTLFLVIARTIDLLALPVVIIGALLAVSLVGAFQLRQDKNLSEKSFISLMSLTLRQLPFIRRSNDNKNKNG